MKTADEIDHVGEGGLKVGEGTVQSIDRGGKTMVVKTADGAEKTGQVTVYYTEEAGHKIAHFFKGSN